ncbi:DUF742 domain-containing protein [Streptomyces meridianus]|uniref:DUF742 domain-containing protein n=1 Tax=Streptomyces meridianus TaxID=2938945 RepID=A0ABT0X2C2_9ACTN|nr:DUF742 domain-containing protein [Streptomyces meridianus]MCM2576350.1 DUF742 domain-containing protein [Streptomyces meridianus]
MTDSEMADLDGPAWADDDAEDVRPYALTNGRTEPRHQMRLASMVVARHEAKTGLAPEAESAVALCRSEPRSVAEIAAVLAQPVLVTKILLSDLIDDGALILSLTSDATCPDDPNLLEALLVGLRRRFPDCG